MRIETKIADPTDKIRETDMALERIKLALQEGILTIDSLKIYVGSYGAAEKAVAYLQEVGMISISPENGEISLNKRSPYGSFEQAFRCYMPVWEKSLEALHVEDPERFGKIKSRLRTMSGEDIRRKKSAVLFMKIFEGEKEVAEKIGEIKEAITQYRDMSICDIRPYREDLTDEMLLFVLLSRREPTETAPLGFIREEEAIGFFKRIGYEDDDVKSVFAYFCEVRILREDPEAEEKRYAILDEPKVMLGDLKSEKRGGTILERKIKSVLDRK